MAPHAAPWKVTLHGGQGWQCEGPEPIGVEPWARRQLPSVHAANKGPAYAIASSYSWGEVMQVAPDASVSHTRPACLLIGVIRSFSVGTGRGPAGAAAGQGHDRPGGRRLPGQQPRHHLLGLVRLRWHFLQAQPLCGTVAAALRCPSRTWQALRPLLSDCHGGGRCGGRFDCASKAEVVVVLDAREDVLPPYVGAPLPSSSQAF